MSDDTTTERGRWVWTARATAATGAVLLSYGAGQAWPPLAFIVGGAILLVIGVGALRA